MCSGGSVITNVSRASFSKAVPVSPAANEMSNFCTSVESAIRKLMYARFLPGHEYAPENQVSHLLAIF